MRLHVRRRAHRICSSCTQPKMERIGLSCTAAAPQAIASKSVLECQLSAGSAAKRATKAHTLARQRSPRARWWRWPSGAALPPAERAQCK